MSLSAVLGHEAQNGTSESGQQPTVLLYAKLIFIQVHKLLPLYCDKAAIGRCAHFFLHIYDVRNIVKTDMKSETEWKQW